MRKRFPQLADFLFFCGQPEKNLCARTRYRCLRRSLLVVMTLMVVIPLCVTTGLSFFQYRRLLQEETYNNARLSAEIAAQTIETFLEKLQAAILVVSDVYTFEDLVDQKRLDHIFAILKTAHPGIVDLSVIGPDGIQRAYVGPYNLIGKDYSSSPWYNKSLTRKIFVSEVFQGFRNVPHFVVAVSSKLPDGQGYWVLRASIDTETLDRFLAFINPEIAEDIFLVNTEGKLQSSSRYHGQVNEQVALPTQPKKRGILLSEERQGDVLVLRALGFIKGTPWILVLDQTGYVQKKNWMMFQKQQLLLFGVCMILVGLSVIKIATFLAGRIREADEIREVVLSQTEHTNKLASIGRLAAGVAHEINNPLAIINEKAGLMKDIISFSENFQHREKFLTQLNSVLDAVSRSRTITHRLLGFARRMDATPEPVGINEVIQEVLGFLDKEAMYRKIKFELNFQEDLSDVRADRGQLQQIFLNIINNSIDAVGEDGEIRIATSGTRQETRADISDNGPGIAPEVRKNIFEPFFTTKKGDDKQGTGLGLFITYGIVKKMGGDIMVHSAVGAGTTFSITLPVDGAGKEGALHE